MTPQWLTRKHSRQRCACFAQQAHCPKVFPRVLHLSYFLQCGVEWAAGSAAGACIHDYGALCPFGWYEHGLECLAPLTYSTCSKRKSFAGMTPAAREDWAHNCKVTWPCRSRQQCSKAYSAPCPAGWYAFNGGASCRAPSSYAGSCAAVLHGLTDLSADEKIAIETKCAFDWPCAGEVYASVLQ